MKEVIVLKNGRVVRMITEEKTVTFHVLATELAQLAPDPQDRWAYLDTMANPTFLKIGQFLEAIARSGYNSTPESAFNPVCVIQQTDPPMALPYTVRCSADCKHDSHHAAYLTAVLKRCIVKTPELTVTPVVSNEVHTTLVPPVGFVGRDYRHTKTGKIYLCIGLTFNVGTGMWDIVYVEKGFIGPAFSQSITRFQMRGAGGKPRFVEVEE